MPGSGGGGPYVPRPQSYHGRMAPYVADASLPSAFGYRYRVLDHGVPAEIGNEVYYELGEVTDEDLQDIACAVVSALNGAEKMAEVRDGHAYATLKMRNGPDYFAFSVFRQNRDDDEALVYVATVYIRRFINPPLGSPVVGEMLVFSKHGQDKKPSFPSTETPASTAVPIELV